MTESTDFAQGKVTFVTVFRKDQECNKINRSERGCSFHISVSRVCPPPTPTTKRIQNSFYISGEEDFVSRFRFLFIVLVQKPRSTIREKVKVIQK